MGHIADTIKNLRNELPDSVQLVAVSKFHPTNAIMEAYSAGQRIFGESRVQELRDKVPALPKDIEWHMIGTLQRNKVKYIIPFIDTIHSIDSTSLIEEIERQCVRLKREEKVKILLEIDISGEENKHGFSEEELYQILDSDLIDSCPHIELSGLMGMASFSADNHLIDSQFAQIEHLFKDIRQRYFSGQESQFRHLSIGMSNDYPIAIKHGATYIRIGTAIFGEREY